MAGRTTSPSGKCTGVSEEELVHIAVKSWGSRTSPPSTASQDHRMAPGDQEAPLVSMTLRVSPTTGLRRPAPARQRGRLLRRPWGRTSPPCGANLTFGAQGLPQPQCRDGIHRAEGAGPQERSSIWWTPTRRLSTGDERPWRLPKKTDEEKAARSTPWSRPPRRYRHSEQVMRPPSRCSRWRRRSSGRETRTPSDATYPLARKLRQGAYLNVLINLPACPTKRRKTLRGKGGGHPGGGREGGQGGPARGP